MEKVIANRLKNARILNGLSMQNVADQLGISKNMISKYEKGVSLPNSNTLIKLSKLFNLKIDYFFNSFKIDIGEVNFRKKSSFSVKKQNALKELIKIKFENYLFVENSLSIDIEFDNPIAHLEIKNYNDIIKAVNQLKTIWEIGFDPVHNIIQILEDKKIKIIELNNVDDKFDGLATYVNKKFPVIVLNENFIVERKRFSLLHELGHLLLNISNNSNLDEEKVCHKFANEFLVSGKMLLEEFGNKRKHITISELVAIQEKYGISIKAIIMKLKDIGILSDTQVSNFYKKMRANFFSESDIDKSRFKTPEYSNRFERLVYRALSQEVISISKAASLLNISIEEIKSNYELI